MPSKRCWLGWGVFVAALVGVGFALDAWLPASPRFVLRDAHLQNFAGEAELCADGKILMTGNLGRTTPDGWVCDSLRSWDTVSGRERGRFFHDLAKADARKLAGSELHYSPGRRYCALVHPDGLAIADLVSGKEWPAALTWENARQGPRQFSPLYRLLQVPIRTGELQDPVKLRTALEILSNRTGGKLVILVDGKAFEDELGVDVPDVYEQEVSLPPVPTKMPAATALRIMLAAICKGQATYVVRRDYIEITTWKHAGEDTVASPVFSPRGSFLAVTEGLSNVHRLHIIECATGERVASFPLHTEVVSFFEFTPDEELLCFFANENGNPLFTVWNTRKRQIERTIREIKPRDRADLFLMAPDGKTLLADSYCTGPGGVDLFDLRTGQKHRCFDVRPPDEPPDKLRQFMFSPDNGALVAITPGKLHIWDMAAGQRSAVIKLADDAWPSEEFLIPANSRVLAAPRWEQGFTAWSLESGKRLWPPKRPAPVIVDDPAAPPGVLNVQADIEEGPVRTYPRITPDHRWLVGSTDGRIDLLDPATGKPRVSVELGDEFGPPHSIKFTPDGRRMLSVWEFKQGRELGLIQKWLGKWWPFPEPRGYVIVTEVATGRTVLRLSDAGAAYDLSDDGGTLMTFLGSEDGAEPGIVSCYDVPGRPSRYAVVGIPLAFLPVALLIRWRLSRKKRPLQNVVPM